MDYSNYGQFWDVPPKSGAMGPSKGFVILTTDHIWSTSSKDLCDNTLVRGQYRNHFLRDLFSEFCYDGGSLVRFTALLSLSASFQRPWDLEYQKSSQHCRYKK